MEEKKSIENHNWSRRFKDGDSRYMTRALIESSAIIIHQTERIIKTKTEVRNVVVLMIDDFKAMVKELGIFDGKDIKEWRQEMDKARVVRKYIREHPDEAEKAMHSMIPKAGTKAFERHIEDITEAMQSLLVLNCDGCTEECPYKNFCTIEL